MNNTGYEGVEAGSPICCRDLKRHVWLKFGAERPKRSRKSNINVNTRLFLEALGYSHHHQPAFGMLSWKRHQLMWFFPLEYDVNHGYLPAGDGYFAHDKLVQLKKILPLWRRRYEWMFHLNLSTYSNLFS
jgi:hypothetical protein